MRVFFMLFVLSLLACTRDLPPEVRPIAELAGRSSAPAAPMWCASSLCATCELDATFYEAGCPEMAPWCAAPSSCPGGLEPLFCSGNPPWTSCVFVSVSVCGESNSTWCCSPDDAPLGEAWYCEEPEDCPPAPDCLVAECWSHNGQPDPFGTWGKCSYAPVSDGSPCGASGACELGACATAVGVP